MFLFRFDLSLSLLPRCQLELKTNTRELTFVFSSSSFVISLFPEPANASLLPSTTPLPFAYHPQTSSVLLPASHPSSLQFYSPELQTSILELEVSPSNRVSRTEDKVVEPARVERAVFSSGGGGGEYMATSEKREEDEEEGGEEERVVKVWRWEEGVKT